VIDADRLFWKCHDRTLSLVGRPEAGWCDGREWPAAVRSCGLPEGRTMVTAREKGGKIKRPAASRAHYSAAYGNFTSELYAEIRAEAFGEDIGQQSWLSAEEQDRLIGWLDLRPNHRLLDVACGSGGPTLRIAERTGCRVHGVDLEAAAIEAAQASVQKRGLTDRAAFAVADA